MNIIVDYNLKGHKSLNEIKKIEKTKIEKIKYFYMDSNELTKDETSNKLEKNMDNNNKKIKRKNKNKILLLADKNNRLSFKKYLENRDNFPELNERKNKKIKNINFKYFNKNDINFFISNKSKTLEHKADINREKKRQFNFSSLNEQIIPKELSIKSFYNINSFNEGDLFNKIKKIKFEKYIINCYKTIKSSEEEDGNNINNNNEDNKRNSKKNQIKNILDSDKKKGILNSAKSKMKTYTNISRLIKHNIIKKENAIKTKKTKEKEKYNNIINKDKKDNKDIKDNKDKKEKNILENLIIQKKDLEEKNDFEDIPQRRPGCSTEKNMTSIFKKIKYKNQNSNRNQAIKKYDFMNLQQKSTFTKSLKVAKTFSKKSEKKKKEKLNATSNLLKSIITKFQTQIFNVKSTHKINKINKNNTKYINLKDNNTSKNNNKCLNFSSMDGNFKNRTRIGIIKSLINNSFSMGIKKNSYNKIPKNSVIKSINLKQ